MEKNDYSMYKCYHGENKSPYEEGTKENFFWFYESAFEDFFQKYDIVDMDNFFSEYGLHDKFIHAVKAVPNNRVTPDNHVTNKNGVFAVWLEYLFTNKLSSWDKDQYNKLRP